MSIEELIARHTEGAAEGMIRAVREIPVEREVEQALRTKQERFDSEGLPRMLTPISAIR